MTKAADGSEDRISGRRIFISYSRRHDSRTARGLKRQILRVGRPFFRRSRRSVFLDVDEAVNGWLSSSLAVSVNECDVFVLLACEASAESKDVATELRTWVEARRTENLVVVDTDDSTAGQTMLMRLAGLTAAQLKDFRTFELPATVASKRMRRDLAIDIAAIADGVNREKLKSRDRSLVRLTRVALVFGAAMMATLAVTAIHTARQRQNAELRAKQTQLAQSFAVTSDASALRQLLDVSPDAIPAVLRTEAIAALRAHHDSTTVRVDNLIVAVRPDRNGTLILTWHGDLYRVTSVRGSELAKNLIARNVLAFDTDESATTVWMLSTDGSLRRLISAPDEPSGDRSGAGDELVGALADDDRLSGVSNAQVAVHTNRDLAVIVSPSGRVYVMRLSTGKIIVSDNLEIPVAYANLLGDGNDAEVVAISTEYRLVSLPLDGTASTPLADDCDSRGMSSGSMDDYLEFYGCMLAAHPTIPDAYYRAQGLNQTVFDRVSEFGFHRALGPYPREVSSRPEGAVFAGDDQPGSNLIYSIAEEYGADRSSLACQASSADGTLVGVCTDRAALVWRVGQSTPVETIPLDGAKLSEIAFEGTGRLVGVGTEDGVSVVITWDISPTHGDSRSTSISGGPINVRGHHSRVNAHGLFAWDPDGRRLIAVVDADRLAGRVRTTAASILNATLGSASDDGGVSVLGNDAGEVSILRLDGELVSADEQPTNFSFQPALPIRGLTVAADGTAVLAWTDLDFAVFRIDGDQVRRQVLALRHAEAAKIFGHVALVITADGVSTIDLASEVPEVSPADGQFDFLASGVVAWTDTSAGHLLGATENVAFSCMIDGRGDRPTPVCAAAALAGGSAPVKIAAGSSEFVLISSTEIESYSITDASYRGRVLTGGGVTSNSVSSGVSAAIQFDDGAWYVSLFDAGDIVWTPSGVTTAPRPQSLYGFALTQWTEDDGVPGLLYFPSPLGGVQFAPQEYRCLECLSGAALRQLVANKVASAHNLTVELDGGS